ncbi:hypothetical protein HEK616_40870 [Streptomyces nigrescens]|uniref:Uncharacterized protein n=1 Tax=Streptomyces nigrescens TaxID=1920 RepID=A0ABM7ZW63_STRNI|nr:hypothetical protein [Streptomyces nigrescens]BDM70600.1 hypothetical protein HEK616_40870 [Streptomyces nigrescens]
MTMPGGIATVTLTGRYIRPDGTPLSGTVTITTPSMLTLSGANSVAAGSTVLTLDNAGSFSVVLVATDNANMQPTGWRYSVTEKFTGVSGRTYSIDLPSTTPTVDIADVAPADPATGNYVTVAGPAGADGRTILSGTSAPASGMGATGDFYIDTSSWTIYGPKTSGAWPSGHALNGGVVSLTYSDVGADPAGAASAAQTAATSAAQSYTDTAIAADVTRANGAYDASGAATSALSSAHTYTDNAIASEVARANGAYVGGSDARLTNARTPTAHASTHSTGGTDAITPAAIGAATSTDITTALAGHVADVMHGDQPSENGLLAWTYDPSMAGHVTAQSNSGVAGRITLTRIMIRKTITWSNVWLGLAGIDGSAVLSNCYLGVYDASGTLKGTTADISSLLMTNAVAKAFALAAPFTATPGAYFVAMLLNGTWATNALTFKGSGAGISVNAGLSAPNLRYSNMLTGQTSLPSSLTLSGQTTTIINTGWGAQWYGVS